MKHLKVTGKADDLRSAKRAAEYATVGWKKLEMEEQAHARTLLREGYLIWEPDESARTTNPALIDPNTPSQRRRD